VNVDVQASHARNLAAVAGVERGFLAGYHLDIAVGIATNKAPSLESGQRARQLRRLQSASLEEGFFTAGASSQCMQHPALRVTLGRS
jgi:hypothetical protein